jgi:hypothetical protein
MGIKDMNRSMAPSPGRMCRGQKYEAWCSSKKNAKKKALSSVEGVMKGRWEV